MMFKLFAVLCLAVSINARCQKAKVVADTYSTKSATLATQTVYLAEFSIACENEEQEQNFYAEINGNLLPVGKSADSGKYQVSWSSEHKTAVKGDIPIKVYDEEGYSAYRKAQRSGDSTAVNALTTITLNHRGAKRDGFVVQTEFLAACIAMGVWWLANTARGKIME